MGLSFVCLAISVFLAVALASPTYAAEVGCNLKYFGHTKNKSFPEEKAKNRWPSGVRPTQETCQIGAIRGEITEGDYAKVVSFYRKHHPFLDSFLLHSSGGNVHEAIRIGRLFREYLIEAESPTTIADQIVLSGYAPDGPWNQFAEPYSTAYSKPLCKGSGCVCASACALIWFGAPQRRGTVGVHRPRTSDPSFKGLPAEDAAKVYENILQSIVSYLNEMNAPKSIIEAMVSTASADILWLDDGVFGDMRMDRAPSFAEWASAACGAISTSDYKKMLALEVKKWDQILIPQEEKQLKAFSEKQQKISFCESELTSSNRDRLPPP